MDDHFALCMCAVWGGLKRQHLLLLISPGIGKLFWKGPESKYSKLHILSVS